MAAPTLILSNQSGAPLLTRAEGTFINVLSYCLTQRGWTIPFTSGASKAVYRSGSGINQPYYRILNNKKVY